MKKVLLGLAALLLLGATGVAVKIGPRNIIGMLRYDQRRDGDLKVGDRAPDAMLMTLDGKGQQPLLAQNDTRPTVLIFGSFT
ncbi:MAG TPA: hypothetical protein VJZ00_07365 [Thermoanaerobaculia bacterium]|nr:hypothetical protein [Thermoanaerobaculia bacterium]